MNERQMEALARRARALLETAPGPDAATRARLEAARRRALAAPARRRIAAGWGAAVAAGLAAAALWLGWPRPGAVPAEALELVVVDAPPELIEELDFFLWLEETEGRDAG
ncbi:hypothetical protein [Inmirania thermothiophila]|uniref:DUF3619 family protein n=1 Tax=Inmirania thermothiophila TaxID=1750597 RepID=A0A3N1Y720_9GAMM|nr:hypothetical protein [Inmirania thermothiophila]ROR34318.1 hypothetical protein EDC57_0214 [Inmirania thermothiophila]